MRTEIRGKNPGALQRWRSPRREETRVQKGRPETILRKSAEVLPKSMIVLANTVERAEEIDMQLAQTARKNAEEALSKPLSETERRTFLLELKRENVRLSIAARRHSPRHPGQISEE